jgi:hypothetical protein
MASELKQKQNKELRQIPPMVEPERHKIKRAAVLQLFLS